VVVAVHLVETSVVEAVQDNIVVLLLAKTLAVVLLLRLVLL
jgi:hypothetical protein